MGFIKELFIGRKIYLTTDLPKDITKVLISKKPGYLMGYIVVMYGDLLEYLLRTVYTMVMLMSGAASPMRGIIGRELLL